jgi:hypothetical protein
MGYDISWTLRRDRGLAPGERAALMAHVKQYRDEIHGYDLFVPAGDDAPGGLIGWYDLRPSHGDPEVSDHGGYLSEIIDEVLDALESLRGIVADATLDVADDFGRFVWNDGWDHQEHDGGGQGAVIPHGEGEGWVRVSLTAVDHAP